MGIADYELDDREVALVLGFSVEYDVTDMVSPKVGVVARIPKSRIDTLAPE